MILDQQIDSILSSIDIISVVRQFTTLSDALSGVCPLCEADYPSLKINKKKQLFFCCHCRRGGNAISFIQSARTSSYVEALYWAADLVRVGLPCPNSSVSKAAHYARISRNNRRNTLEAAQKFFELNLPAAEKFIYGRGLDRDTVTQFKLGFAPDSWRNLLDYLTSIGHAEDTILELGLARKSKKGVLYDTFRGRVTFPVLDKAGQLVAFSGRDTVGGDRAKYVNSPETVDYVKGDVLFGLPQAREHILLTGEAIVVEGNFDLVMMHRYDFRGTVAPLGTALTEGQAAQIPAKSVTVLFDQDDAGIAAAARSVNLLKSKGFKVAVAHLPEGKDPADVLKEAGGPEPVEQIILDRVWK